MSNKKDLLTFSTIHHIVCLFISLGLTMWCIFEYSLDKDVTEMKTKAYHDTSDDIYPSLTICYKNPYKEDEDWDLDKNSSLWPPTILTGLYQNWIGGDKALFEGVVKSWKPSRNLKNKTKEVTHILRDIDYDDVTINVEDIIVNYQIEIAIDYYLYDFLLYDVVNNSLVLNITRSGITNNGWTKYDGLKNVKTYISARESSLKCFTFDVPFQKELEIRKIEMKLNASIFLYGLDLTQMYFTLAYPGQFFRTSLGNRIIAEYHWGLPKCFKFEIFVGSIEVHKRRDKKSSKCDNDWKNHDQNRLQEIMKKIGCRPQQWDKIPNTSIPNCSNIQEYQKFNKELSKKKGYIPPCRSIEKLSKTTKGKDLSRGCSKDSIIEVELFLDQENLYKEIGLVRAYTFQSLIGNAGQCIIIITLHSMKGPY